MMEYLDANQMRTRRIVDPIELRRVSGELVLIAHCHLRNDRRNFKLERIVRLIGIDAPEAGQPPHLATSDNQR
jgi:predicted DNA-binding transcriptional regulator YafY